MMLIVYTNIPCFILNNPVSKWTTLRSHYKGSRPEENTSFFLIPLIFILHIYSWSAKSVWSGACAMQPVFWRSNRNRSWNATLTHCHILVVPASKTLTQMRNPSSPRSISMIDWPVTAPLKQLATSRSLGFSVLLFIGAEHSLTIKEDHYPLCEGSKETSKLAKRKNTRDFAPRWTSVFIVIASFDKLLYF